MDRPATAWRVLETDGGIDRDSASPAEEPTSGLAGIGFLPIVGLGVAAVLAIAAFALAAGGGDSTVGVQGAGGPIGPGASAADGSAGVQPLRSGGPLLVDVQGAVAHPGVVRLVAGSRVGDAIAAAGGYGPRVDANLVGRQLNLAAPVRDGDQIVVPSRDDRGGDPAASERPSSGGGGALIDLNRASATELDSLPGIGPVTAAKIIAARDEQPFVSVDDLQTRKLVPSSTFEKLKDLVTVR